MSIEDPPHNSGGSFSMRHADSMRTAFRLLNRFMVPLWQLGLGGLLNSWPSVGGRLMVLTHRGRRSGIVYRTPLNYAIVDEHVYCVAGFGGASDWYRNALAAAEVEVWLPDGWWKAKPVDVSTVPERMALMRAVLIGSGFATYAAGIDPRRLTDSGLDKKTHEYRLLRLERTTARTGPGGPGEYAWVWPWVATAAMAELVRQRRKTDQRTIT